LKRNAYFFLLLLFVGCYSFTGASIPAHLKTVGIPLTTDNSGFGRSEMRQEMTNFLVEKFTREGSLQVRDRSTSDAVLDVTITRIADDPVAVKAGEELTRKRATIYVQVTYRDMKLQKLVWDRSFQQFADYDVSAGLEGLNTAIRNAEEKLAEDILLAVISNW
jgi:lipopolysaccharide assembly LptE-like protein